MAVHLCVCICVYTKKKRRRDKKKSQHDTTNNFNRCACIIFSTLSTSVFDTFHNNKWSTKVPVRAHLTWHKALPTGTHASGLLISAGARQPCLPALSSLPHPSHGTHQSSCVQQVPLASESYLCLFIPIPPFTFVNITLPGSLFWLLGGVGMAPLQGPLLSYLMTLLFSTRLKEIVFVPPCLLRGWLGWTLPGQDLRTRDHW